MAFVAVLNDKMLEKGLHTEGSLFEKKRDFDGGRFDGFYKRVFKSFRNVFASSKMLIYINF